MATVSAHPVDDRDPIMVELGANLSRLMDERHASYKTLERALWRLLADDAPSHETIRQYHLGLGTAARAQLRVIAGLCLAYGVPMAEVSEEFARRGDALAELLRSAITGTTLDIDQYLSWAQPRLPLADGWDQTDEEPVGWMTRQSLTATGSGNAPADSLGRRCAATASSSALSSSGSELAA